MKVRIKIASWVLPLLLSAPWSVPTPAGAFTTNTVEKVADLFSGKDLIGNIYGGYNPESRFTQVGTNLWFTTAGGGLNGDGTISTFSLISHEVTQVAYLDKNTSGKAPDSPILVINETTATSLPRREAALPTRGRLSKLTSPAGRSPRSTPSPTPTAPLLAPVSQKSGMSFGR